MRLDVRIQRRLGDESPRTKGALVRTHSAMQPHVPFQDLLRAEGFFTGRAYEALLFRC